MQLSGSHVIGAAQQRVWEALQDPEVLVATLPGCRRLEVVADDTYEVTVELGVASITGTYRGEVALVDQQPPAAYTIRAKGQGGPGTVDATVSVELEPDGADATRVSYEADAAIGGSIAGVGQRVLSSAARRTAAEFFESVERHLVEPAAPAAPSPAGVAAAEGATGPGGAAGSGGVETPGAAQAPAGRVYEAPPKPARSDADSPRMLLLAALAGAAVALLGVLVGRRGG